jgi:hypothetical protein
MRLAFFRLWFLAVLILFYAGRTPTAAAQAKDEVGNGAEQKDPAAMLQRTQDVMQFARVGDSVIHYRAAAASEQNYQSDRSYPPFFSAMETQESWLDVRSGVERVDTQITFPGQGPSPAQTTFTDAARAFRLREKNLTALPRVSMRERYLNPWAVIRDWATAQNVRLAGHEVYRDYVRIVLSRTTPSGEQRLFLDPKSGFPVKLDFEEKHYLWGQRHVEYLWTNWVLSGGVMMPGSSFRLADGDVEISETIGDLALVERAAAPLMSLPNEPAESVDALPLFLQPIDPTISKVGSSAYLLMNPGYTEAVIEVGDEVYLFDSTQGEERSRKDADAIAKLFPGYKKITVVVSDLAWPHIAGVRYWVANGATIVAHTAARDFLQTVVDRRWTLAPDLLEQKRSTAQMKFVGVDAPYQMANGAISLHPIDGIGSEVSLMVYLATERLLWAGDYIQTVDEPSAYATEVWRAVQRDGLHPERTAAEHLPLTPWSKIEALQNTDAARANSNSR